MKVAAIVGVKDERDLIGPCLERLRALGVGPILVLDDRSSDGTLDVVDRFGHRGGRAAPPLERATFAADFGDNLRCTSPVFGPFLQRHAPDWLLFIDADEFPICTGDDLPATLARAAGPVLAIERFNVPLTRRPFLPTSGVDAALFLDAFRQDGACVFLVLVLVGSCGINFVSLSLLTWPQLLLLVNRLLLFFLPTTFFLMVIFSPPPQ